MITKFLQLYPELAAKMMECNHFNDIKQPNKYHLEGSVWTHTCLVYKNAHTDFMKALALTHDIGKIDTKYHNFTTNKTSFSGHPGVSAFKAIGILKSLGLSELDTIFAFRIIASHMDHHILTEEQFNEKYKFNHTTGNLVRAFGMLDDAGRITNDDIVIKKFVPEASKLPVEAGRTVTLMIGLPCSGKSSYVAKQTNTMILSRDALIEEFGKGNSYNEKWKTVDQTQIDIHFRERKKGLIKYSNGDIIVDMTNLSAKSRRKTLADFKGFKKKAVVCLCDFEELMRRNTGRFSKVILDDIYLKMMSSFSIPTLVEFDEIEYILD